MDGKRRDEPANVPEDAKLNTLVSALGDAQVKARTESEERIQKVNKRRRRVHPIVPVILLFPLAWVMYLNLAPAPSGPPVPAEVSLQRAVFLTARVLEAEFDETGAFPADLSEIGMDREGLLYAQTPEGYWLAGEKDSVRVEYEYGEDSSPLETAFETLLPPLENGR